MKADGWLIKKVKDFLPLFMYQMISQFDALQFPAGQGSGRLSQPKLAQPDLGQRPEPTHHVFFAGKKI